MKKIYILVLAVILIIIGGLLIYQPLFQKDEIENIIGGDKDDHGCLVAAGYSWCEAKQKCLRIWEEGCGITNQPASHENIPQREEDCKEQKGEWVVFSSMSEGQCNLPTSDAGKSCLCQEECEGACLADLSKEDQDRIINQREAIEINGRCTPWLLVIGGCHAYVENGIVDGILCIEIGP